MQTDGARPFARFLAMTPVAAALESVRPTGGRTTTARTYDPDEQVDLAGFAGSLSTYSLLTALMVAAARSRGPAVPDRYGVADIVLGGVATHKFARLISKSSVGSPIRAPFVEFQGAAGSGEHHERPRESSTLRKTIGELLSCPFCLGVWISTGYVAGLTFAPRASRAWAAVMAVTATSDFLQHAYAHVRED